MLTIRLLPRTGRTGRQSYNVYLEAGGMSWLCQNVYRSKGMGYAEGLRRMLLLGGTPGVEIVVEED